MAAASGAVTAAATPEPGARSARLFARACLTFALGAVAGCGGNTSNPMTHPAPIPPVAVLRITGNGALTAVGQTAQ